MGKNIGESSGKLKINNASEVPKFHRKAKFFEPEEGDWTAGIASVRGKEQGETGALPRFALYPHPSPMSFNDMFDDG